MYKTGGHFHYVHMSDDVDELDRWYERVLGARRWGPKSYMAAEKRDASSLSISTFAVETMAPAKVEGADLTTVGKFYKRFGRHLGTLGWYVESVEDASTHLKGRNVRVYGVGGGTGGGSAMRVIFTHPLDTHGQWELMEPTAHWHEHDLRFSPSWSDASWRSGPMGIMNGSHFTVVVRDLEKAKSAYMEYAGSRVIREEQNKGAQTECVFVAVGEGTVVELARPTSEQSLAGQDLAKNGELLHAVTWRVKDAKAAKEHLRRLNVRVEDRDAETFIMNPDDSFGAVLQFTQRDILRTPPSR